MALALLVLFGFALGVVGVVLESQGIVETKTHYLDFEYGLPFVEYAIGMFLLGYYALAVGRGVLREEYSNGQSANTLPYYHLRRLTDF